LFLKEKKEKEKREKEKERKSPPIRKRNFNIYLNQAMVFCKFGRLYRTTSV